MEIKDSVVVVVLIFVNVRACVDGQFSIVFSVNTVYRFLCMWNTDCMHVLCTVTTVHTIYEDLQISFRKAKIHLYFKMTSFNDLFLMKKMYANTPLIKKWNFLKSLYSEHGPWRRTCCCCRCKKCSTWVKPGLIQRNILGLCFRTLLSTNSLQMQTKLLFSSCFLFMVAILPLLHQLFFYLMKQKFLKNVYFLFWTWSYRKYMAHKFDTSIFQ